MQIYNTSGQLLFQDDAKDIGKTIENALSKNTSLAAVCLNGEYIANISFEGLNLAKSSFAPKARRFSLWLNGAELFKVDFRHANLKDADFMGVTAYVVDFSGANLQNADFYDATLFEVNFSGANLKGANLKGVNLKGENLTDANLEGATMTQADLDRIRGQLTEEQIKQIITNGDE